MPPVSSVRSFFLRNVSFRVSNFVKTVNNRILGKDNTGKIQQHELRSKEVTVLYAVPAIAVVCPYYLNNEPARAVNYYQILGIYVRSETQRLPNNAVTSRMELLPTLRTVSIFLFQMFRNSWTRKCGLKGFSGRSQTVAQLDYSSGVSEKSSALDFCASFNVAYTKNIVSNQTCLSIN